VITFDGVRKEGRHGRAYWICVCECGQSTTVNGRDLQRGHTKSCGCLKREPVPAAVQASTKHGKRHTPEYNAWRSMKKRCLLSSSRSYARYGGRGISIDPQWMGSFDAFYRDVGPRPSPDHSLDRMDNNKGYSAQNCRWALPQEQQANRSDTIKVQYQEEMVCLAELDRILGAPYETSAHYHIGTKGMSVEAYVSMIRSRNKKT